MSQCRTVEIKKKPTAFNMFVDIAWQEEGSRPIHIPASRYPFRWARARIYLTIPRGKGRMGGGVRLCVKVQPRGVRIGHFYFAFRCVGVFLWDV